MCSPPMCPVTRANMIVQMSGSTDEDQPMLNPSLTPSLTRRRLIVIAATAAGSAYLTGARMAVAGDPVRWHGSALGAQVSIEIHHPDRAEAERLVERCVQQVRRLEQQFSLYRADSAISTLNRTGILVAPDAD